MRRRCFLLGGLAAVSGGFAFAGAAGGEGVVPPSDYDTGATRARWGAWGPPARTLPAPSGLVDDPALLQRCILAAARRHVGLGYQHHHLPDFDPPGDWPWLPVSAGRNGPGLDCSNFTSLAFNEALGIKLPTAIGTQAEARVVAGPGGLGSVTLRRIAPASYDDAVASLHPADLLFIRSDAGRLSHVVLWLGDVRGMPFFIDCTDTVRRDVDGGPIPTGIRVRPFLPESWYARRFSHAHRLDGLGTGSAPQFEDGGDV